MARAARPVFCQLRAYNSTVAPEVQKLKPPEAKTAAADGKIVLQPRLCTLRSFAGDRGGGGVIKDVDDDGERVSRFFEILTDYVDSSKRSQDFEIISGRLAMIVFAATVSVEVATGNSIFRKTDLQGLEDYAGICVAAIATATISAWFTSNRKRVGRILNLSANTFIDSLIDNIVDALFYNTNDLNDWSDDDFY